MDKIEELYIESPSIGLVEFRKRTKALIDTAVREELELASRVNEEKELGAVIAPHNPYRMRAWFKDRVAIVDARRKAS